MMKFIGFEHEIFVVVKFKREEIDQLCRLAAMHYDGRCKALALPGGRLWGMANRAAFGAADCAIGSSDLQLLMKICEIGTPEALSFRDGLRDVWRQNRKEWSDRWNSEEARRKARPALEEWG